MKQVRIFLFTLLGLLVSDVALAEDKPIPVEQLPEAAKTFVKKHFKDKKIAYAEKDGFAYECRLDDGTKIEFTRRGNWDKVECNPQTAVPAALVPKAIQKYVKNNYGKEIITKIDKERYGYEIELSNDLDLKFNKNGAFIGID